MTERTQGPATGLTPHLTIADGRGAEAIDFYKAAFGASEVMRMTGEDSAKLMHAHLLCNDASLMIADDWSAEMGYPRSGPPAAVTLHLQVDNADRWYNRAVAAGATGSMPPADMFWGDRYGQVIDPFGHKWALASVIAGETGA